jgi:hypothetical protein
MYIYGKEMIDYKFMSKIERKVQLDRVTTFNLDRK